MAVGNLCVRVRSDRRPYVKNFEIEAGGSRAAKGSSQSLTKGNQVEPSEHEVNLPASLSPHTVLIYAQRGHGKRSSFYSDYRFGAWSDGALVPVGKAYSGFTDEELRRLDKWVRDNTVNRFGPVREVMPGLVLEIAFDSVHRSNRHKSGVAMRFPRVHRIRWDKPFREADTLATLEAMMA